MKSYSPYDNLERKGYPAMLVETSLNDSQVMYWEPAKYVAKLRHLKTDAQSAAVEDEHGRRPRRRLGPLRLPARTSLNLRVHPLPTGHPPMNFRLSHLSPIASATAHPDAAPAADPAPEARHKLAQPVRAGWVHGAIPCTVGAAHSVIPLTRALAPYAPRPGDVVILRQTDSRIARSKCLDHSPLTVPCSLTTTHYSLLTTHSPQ